MFLPILCFGSIANGTTTAKVSTTPVTVTRASTSSNGTHLVMTSQSIDLRTQEEEGTTTGYAVRVSPSTASSSFETEFTSEAPRKSQNAPDVFIIATSATCALIALIVASVVLSVIIRKRISLSHSSQPSTQRQFFNLNATPNTSLEGSTEQGANRSRYEEVPIQLNTTVSLPLLDRELATHMTSFTTDDSFANNGVTLNSQPDPTAQASTTTEGACQTVVYATARKSAFNHSSQPVTAEDRPASYAEFVFEKSNASPDGESVATEFSGQPATPKKRATSYTQDLVKHSSTAGCIDKEGVVPEDTDRPATPKKRAFSYTDVVFEKASAGIDGESLIRVSSDQPRTTKTLSTAYSEVAIHRLPKCADGKSVAPEACDQPATAKKRAIPYTDVVFQKSKADAYGVGLAPDNSDLSSKAHQRATVYTEVVIQKSSTCADGEVMSRESGCEVVTAKSPAIPCTDGVFRTFSEDDDADAMGAGGSETSSIRTARSRAPYSSADKTITGWKADQ